MRVEGDGATSAWRVRCGSNPSSRITPLIAAADVRDGSKRTSKRSEGRSKATSITPGSPSRAPTTRLGQPSQVMPSALAKPSIRKERESTSRSALALAQALTIKRARVMIERIMCLGFEAQSVRAPFEQGVQQVDARGIGMERYARQRLAQGTQDVDARQRRDGAISEHASCGQPARDPAEIGEGLVEEEVRVRSTDDDAHVLTRRRDDVRIVQKSRECTTLEARGCSSCLRAGEPDQDALVLLAGFAEGNGQLNETGVLPVQRSVLRRRLRRCSQAGVDRDSS